MQHRSFHSLSTREISSSRGFNIVSYHSSNIYSQNRTVIRKFHLNICPDSKGRYFSRRNFSNQSRIRFDSSTTTNISQNEYLHIYIYQRKFSSKSLSHDWIFPRPKLSGSCGCGTVGWEGHGPSSLNYICHSKNSRQASGLNAIEICGFLPSQIIWRNKEGLEVRSSSDGDRLHCKNCGDYIAHDATQTMGVYGLPLNKATTPRQAIEEIYLPNQHIFYEERTIDANDLFPKWKTIPDGELVEYMMNLQPQTESFYYDSETKLRNEKTGQLRKDVLSFSPSRKPAPKTYRNPSSDPFPNHETQISSSHLEERINQKYAPSPNQFIAPKKTKRDVIIIGGGHNGLVAAAYLAKSGLDVLVLERRHVVGGAAVTEELIPGFKFSRASYLAGLFRPQIIKELELEKYGFKYLPRDPTSFTPSSLNGPLKGKYLLLGSNDEENWKSIAQFSKRDADVFPHYEAFLSKVRKIINPLLDGPPPDPTQGKMKERLGSMKQISQLIQVGYQNKQVLVPLYELLTAPAAHILDRWFESDILKTTLATDAVIGALMSPNQPGSAYVLLHHVMGESAGREGVWAYSQGGMGTISESIRKSAERYGAEIALNATVKKILFETRNGQPQVTGVQMQDGTKLSASTVLSGCNPYHTFLELLPGLSHDSIPSPLPAEFRKHIQFADYQCGAFKINCAVDKLPNFACFPHNPKDPTPGPQHKGTIHFETTMEEIENAYREASLGVPATRPVIELTIPSSLDTTISPPGKHVINLFVQFAPYHVDPKVGTWKDTRFKNTFADRVFRVVDEFAPGFSESVIARDVLSPLDLESVFGLHKGNIFHGALGLHQLGYARPAPGYSRYRTPLSGLYLCASGAHPGGGVMGAPGRNCANIVLSDLAK